MKYIFFVSQCLDLLSAAAGALRLRLGGWVVLGPLSARALVAAGWLSRGTSTLTYHPHPCKYRSHNHFNHCNTKYLLIYCMQLDNHIKYT